MQSSPPPTTMPSTSTSTSTTNNNNNLSTSTHQHHHHQRSLSALSVQSHTSVMSAESEQVGLDLPPYDGMNAYPAHTGNE